MSQFPMFETDHRLQEKAKEFMGDIVQRTLQGSDLGIKVELLVLGAYKAGYMAGEDSLMKKAEEIANLKKKS